MTQSAQRETSMFTSQFNEFVCAGDTIMCSVDGFEITATVVHDDDASPEDLNAPGFWVGDPTRGEREIIDAWKRDEWFYAGIVLSVSRNGVTLDDHAVSLWGVEANFPESDDNSHLTEVANDLLQDAVEQGRKILKLLIG